jgi:aspartyl-tRNA(Asn)/glutamyl-tRNA(Gln) amidotransferase subunit C
MDKKELEETAELAHLNVSPDELAAAQGAFEQMLGFFAAMQGADNDPALGEAGSVAQGQAAGAALVNSAHFRGDQAPTDLNTGSVREKLLANAGGRDGNFIVIPNVL